MRNVCFSAAGLVFLSAFAGFGQIQVPLNTAPSRILGHPNPEANTGVASINPNLVEGRELFAPQGIALDTSVTPPVVYVSDTSNNRVLGWKNATGFTNGQPADLVIGQQDFFHTNPLGPGTTFSTGLARPTGLAVYKSDLYIVDTDNNRVLRFRNPVANAGNLFPDLFIGQPNLSSRTANYTGKVAAQGLNLQGQFQANISFDSTGNLWLTDAGNQRVLRFKAADVAGSGGPLTSDLVLGQLDFVTVQPSVNVNNSTTTNLFAIPLALGFDPSGRLFVSDYDSTLQVNRVLVFDPKGASFTNGMAASRIMGLFTQGTSTDQINKTTFILAAGLFFIPGTSGKVGLADFTESRILLFDSYDKWPDQNTSYSPQATAVVGQLAFNVTGQNGGATYIPAPSNTTLAGPASVAFSGTELYIADAGNHRAIVMPLQAGVFGPATRVLGQDRFDMSAPNLIEGREFNFRNQAVQDSNAGVAVDLTGDTPHLYVADTYNNRVLGFSDYRKAQAGKAADIVIGQADFSHGLCNGNGDPNNLSSSSLCFPTGVLVDSSGNLFVADSGNGRILRFPAPFAHQGLEQADLVLGQHNFTSKITDPTAFTMAAPYGLAIAGSNGLLASDLVHNRVLFFPFTNGTFTGTDSGKAATKVLGQPDFSTITSGSALTNMSGPHHIATDSNGQVYVADAGNNRVLIFDTIGSLQNGSAAAFRVTGLNSPRGVWVNSSTGEIWITDSNTGLVKKYPKFETLVSNPNFTSSVQSVGATLAITQDQFGDLIVADSSNRVAFYYPGLQTINGGSFISTLPLAPGMFASICSAGSNCSGGASLFGGSTANYSDLPNPLPLPTSLGDTQVLFNGQPAPLYYVSPTQINFYVPMGAPTSGNADVQVIQASTSRVYAAGSAPMGPYSPAMLTVTYTGKSRPALVLNQDNTLNSPSNPAKVGTIIQIYAIGQGYVPNAPPDGSPATGQELTPFTPRVNIGGIYTDEYAISGSETHNFVQYSGLAPGYVGLWQINVKLPLAVSPGQQVPIFLLTGATLSLDGSFNTTIAVSQ